MKQHILPISALVVSAFALLFGAGAFSSNQSLYRDTGGANPEAVVVNNNGTLIGFI